MCAAIIAVVDIVAMVTDILLRNILKEEEEEGRALSNALLTDEDNKRDRLMTSLQRQRILAPLNSEIH